MKMKKFNFSILSLFFYSQLFEDSSEKTKGKKYTGFRTKLQKWKYVTIRKILPHVFHGIILMIVLSEVIFKKKQFF